jgi:hypothetical protein
VARLRDEGDVGNLKIIVIGGRDPRFIRKDAAVLAKPVEVPELLGCCISYCEDMRPMGWELR